jgi:hypothetical protein
MLAWAKDWALLRSTPGAAPGAKTGARVERTCSALCSHSNVRRLRAWHQRDKPSRHYAATSGPGCHSPLTYTSRAEFHFTVSQDRLTRSRMGQGDSVSISIGCRIWLDPAVHPLSVAARHRSQSMRSRIRDNGAVRPRNSRSLRRMGRRSQGCSLPRLGQPERHRENPQEKLYPEVKQDTRCHKRELLFALALNILPIRHILYIVINSIE